MNPIITVVIPIRVQPRREKILEHLEFCQSAVSDGIEFLVVDDGSEPHYEYLLLQKCSQLGLRYVSTQADPLLPFNLSRARNYAAIMAKGKYVFFMDVDLLPYPEFYKDLKAEIEFNELEKAIDAFLMIPVVYLNEEGLARYRSIPDHLKKHFSADVLLKMHSSLIEKYSFGTSCVLVNRHYYLSIGGQDEAFEGWGYEDYEFTTRLMRLHDYYPKPKKYESMTGNFMTIKQYEGWKAEYRLYGLNMAMKNIFLLHVPHEVDEQYKKNHHNNLKLLTDSLKIDWQRNFVKNIIPDSQKTLLLSKNPFCYSYKLNSILGQVEYLPSEQYCNYLDILNYFKKNQFTQIVLPNPYGNEIFKALYEYCTEHKIPYLVAERGALPDSTFLDPNGFLYDSSSYQDKYWDRPLTAVETKQVTEYLAFLSDGGKTLERQPGRRSKAELIQLLSIPDDVIKIGIILQTENDTVIRFFGREFDSLESVEKFVSNVIVETDRRIHFIYKNHPLEPKKISIDYATNADDLHINDVIDLCDCILTVNSGAGLIAAVLGKPVFTLGDCWYAQTGIAKTINSVSDFIANLLVFKPDKEKILRFTHFLRFRFYCIGKQHTTLHDKGDAIINATHWIDYEEVQTSSFGRLYFRPSQMKVGFDSLLFNFYEDTSLQSLKPKKISVEEKKRRKLKKLKERPFRYFLDAIRKKLELIKL